VFDWTKPRQLDAYFALHQPIEDDGADLWWLDWCCDGSSAQAPGLSADTWINSRYAARNVARGSRWPVLSRIGGSFQGEGPDGDASAGDNGAGVFAEHRYAIHFTGDTCATWPMLTFEARFTAEEGNAGLPYVSHDIGSFNGSPLAGSCMNNPNSKLDDDVYVRWLQFGTFQPLDRLHSNHGARLPWEYSPPIEAIATRYLRLREALVPYLYTLAREAYDTGLPLTRALYLQWPEQSGAYEHPTEYTLGRDMLVAPVTSPGAAPSQSVWIPPGTWFDYTTGARFSGPANVDMTVPLDRYPVFVRAGAIIPTQEGERTVLTVWPGARGSFDLYDDQGQGLAYRRGAFTRTRITTDGRSFVRIAPARGTFPGAPARRAWRVRFGATTVDTGPRSTRRATTVRIRR
jgi:alpha-glucosidase (family GH31 glycosyl hydrolase)